MFRLTDHLKHPASRFYKEEDGSYTAFGAFMLLTFLLLGSTAIDYANAFAARTQLQNGADIAAHAALFTRDTEESSVAKQKALDMVETYMPASQYGGILNASDIRFGYLTRDNGTMSFEPDPDSKLAVEVRMERSELIGNGINTFLLKLIGLDVLDVSVSAIFERQVPGCTREGFFANEVVDLQSNNVFREGFCIHSDSQVELNQNNVFEKDVVVSYPTPSDLVIPASGLARNDGLEDAKSPHQYFGMDVDARIDKFHGDVQTTGGEFSSDILTTDIPKSVSTTGKSGSVDPSSFKTGGMHSHSCNGNKSMTFDAGTYSDFVLVTDCEIKFSQGTVLKDVVISTTNTSSRSFSAPSGLVIGDDDGCKKGGEVLLMTKGGMSNASKVEIYGSKIIAGGDVSFAANNNGVEGVSIVAGGRIDATSNSDMGFCGDEGVPGDYDPYVFRLAF
ncbi:MAG: Tad domain-containing protein [Litoreibacter sp.]|nr:Tad domain-containing protein [Boseongicola sp.]NNK77779.1 Tad domain-containing protein [Litoreibacter sp.]